jgi:hypothetical protein
MRVLHLTTEFPPVIYGGLGTAVGGLVKASAATGIATGVLLFGETAGRHMENSCRCRDARPCSDACRAAGATIFEVSWFQEIEAIANGREMAPTFFTCIRSGLAARASAVRSPRQAARLHRPFP